MKLTKTVIVICALLLMILAETTRISILRRLEMGFSVSEYESQTSQFLQSLAFAPFGLAIGVGLLFFPQHVMRWYDKLIGRARLTYSRCEGLGLQLMGLIFLSATLVALWTTGRFLLQ